jgi:hypothetical protein
VLPQSRLVTVLNTEIETAPQLLVAVGTSKSKPPTPHSFVLFPEHIITGPRVSMLASVWLQVLVLPQGSVASHVRVATKLLPQAMLVTVLSMVMLAVPQILLAVGVSKLNAEPHSLVLFPAQVIVGTPESTVAIV